MRTFAEKPKATRQIKPVVPAPARPASSGHRSRAGSLLQLQRVLGNRAVRRLLQANASRPASIPALRRQPAPGPAACKPDETAVTAVYLQPSVTKCIKITSGGTLDTKGLKHKAQYRAHTLTPPAKGHEKDKELGAKDVKPTAFELPVLVYPPAFLSSPTANVFVFFHGYRATLGELTAAGRQGEEFIATLSHLREAVAGTDRIGIAPQAPRSWRWKAEMGPGHKPKVVDGKEQGEWAPYWDWQQALQEVHFKGLIDIALAALNEALNPEMSVGAGSLHVAGHSGGGVGIEEATNIGKGAGPYGDQIQDVTLQDAGYGGHSRHLMQWFLKGSPPKTVRILVSHYGGGTPERARGTRGVLTEAFNKKGIEDAIAKEGSRDTLEVKEAVKEKPATSGSATSGRQEQPKSGGLTITSQDQSTRVGGYTIESMFEVRYKQGVTDDKTGVKHKPGDLQGTVVVFFALGGGHYAALYASLSEAAAAGPGTTTGFLPEVKVGEQYRVITGTQSNKVPTYKDPDHKAKARELLHDTLVTVLAVQPGTFKDKELQDKPITVDHAQIKVDGDSVWIPLANLAAPLPAPPAPPPTPAPPAQLQPKRLGASIGPTAATGLAGPLHTTSGALSGTAHQALQRRNLPLPQGAIASSALDPLDTPEETAFRDKVYDAQQQWAIRHKTFTAGIPDSELDVIEDGQKMLKAAVPDAKALLEQARTDLAAKQAAGDKHARKVKKIGIDNAYRGMERERINWQNAFLTHYNNTKEQRAALRGGEFGKAAVQLLVDEMINYKAIPGFSNHSKGLAIDFMTDEKGLGELGPYSSQKESWRKSWFWDWLRNNAAGFNFSPLASEEWHWDHADVSAAQGP